MQVYRGSFWLKRILLTTRQSHWPLLLKRQKEIPGTSETPARSLTREASPTRPLGVSGMLVEAGRRLQTTGDITCYRCGGPHLAPACKFKNTECLYCKKKGHLARVCKAKARRKQPSQHVAHYVEEQDSLEEDIFTIIICDQKCSPIVIDILLNDVPVKMEVDTGAFTTVISQATFRLIQQRNLIDLIDLRPSKVRLKTYTGHAIPIVGCARLQARYDKQQSDVVRWLQGMGLTF